MRQTRRNGPGDPVAELLCSVQLPLENIEFAIERYLDAHGVRLDAQTRCLLAQVRDSVGRVAASSRTLAAPGTRPTAGPAEADAAARSGIGSVLAAASEREPEVA